MISFHIHDAFVLGLLHKPGPSGGVFAQRGHSAHTAPIIMLFSPGTPLHTPPPTEACMIHSKQHRGCIIQGPGTHGYRRWRTAAFSHSAGAAPGAAPMDPLLDQGGHNKLTCTVHVHGHSHGRVCKGTTRRPWERLFGWFPGLRFPNDKAQQTTNIHLTGAPPPPPQEGPNWGFWANPGFNAAFTFIGVRIGRLLRRRGRLTDNDRVQRQSPRHAQSGSVVGRTQCTLGRLQNTFRESMAPPVTLG